MHTRTVAHMLGASLLLATLTAVPAFAQSPEMWDRSFDRFNYASPDETVRIDGSIGAIFIEGSEKVMYGSNTLSHLIWQSTAPVLRGSIAVNLPNGFSLRGEGSVAGFASSYMEDYDWLKGDFTTANWSHRSQHPDTNLDHYFTGAGMVGYELVRDDKAVIRAHGGLKYTDVQWAAYGGTYVYSSGGGFRDQVGSWPAGTPGITYRQQLPEVFLGVDGEETYGNFRVGGLLRGGLTFLSVATDDHWMRNLRFVDELYVAPTVTVGADIGFALGKNAEVTLAARYDHIFEVRGDTRYYNIASGAQTHTLADVAAGGLRSAEITAGLRGRF